MHSFTDSTGRVWEVSISIASIKQLKSSPLAIDLLKLNVGRPTLLTRLGTEIELTIDTIWQLVANQAEEAGISELEFAGNLGGEAASSALDAFFGELLQFLRQVKRFQDACAVEQMRTTIALATERTAAKIEQINVHSLVDKAMDSVTVDDLPSVE